MSVVLVNKDVSVSHGVIVGPASLWSQPLICSGFVSITANLAGCINTIKSCIAHNASDSNIFYHTKDRTILYYNCKMYDTHDRI